MRMAQVQVVMTKRSVSICVATCLYMFIVFLVHLGLDGV